MVVFLQQVSPNRWYNIAGAVLGVGCWNGGYIRNFPLLPSGVPIAPTDLGVRGKNLSQVWYSDRPIIVLDKFVFVYLQSTAVQKYSPPKTIGVEILAKIWEVLPLVKRGQHGSNVCGYFMSTAWSPTVGIVSVDA